MASMSNTACLTHVFFKSGEYCSKFNEPYWTSNAVEITKKQPKIWQQMGRIWQVCSSRRGGSRGSRATGGPSSLKKMRRMPYIYIYIYVYLHLSLSIYIYIYILLTIIIYIINILLLLRLLGRAGAGAARGEVRAVRRCAVHERQQGREDLARELAQAELRAYVYT